MGLINTSQHQFSFTAQKRSVCKCNMLKTNLLWVKPNQVNETRSRTQSFAFCFFSDILNLFYSLTLNSKCQGEKWEIKQCRNNIFVHYAQSIYTVAIFALLLLWKNTLIFNQSLFCFSSNSICFYLNWSIYVNWKITYYCYIY